MSDGGNHEFLRRPPWSTAHHVHGLLSSILRSAVEDGYLARNPAARTAPRRGPRRAVQPLTVAQVQALLAATPEKFRSRCCPAPAAACGSERSWGCRSAR